MVTTRFKRHDLIKGARGKEGKHTKEGAMGLTRRASGAGRATQHCVAGSDPGGGLKAARKTDVEPATAVARMRAAATAAATTRPPVFFLGASATRRGLSSGTVYSTAMMHYDTWMWVVCLRLGYVWCATR